MNMLKRCKQTVSLQLCRPQHILSDMALEVFRVHTMELPKQLNKNTSCLGARMTAALTAADDPIGVIIAWGQLQRPDRGLIADEVPRRDDFE